ncbi:hypothetical protein ACLOJK_019089 [Asimina triloba]
MTEFRGRSNSRSRIDDARKPLLVLTCFSLIAVAEDFETINLGTKEDPKLLRIGKCLSTQEREKMYQRQPSEPQQVQYLGHVVSGDGVAAEKEKIVSIMEWPMPQNKGLLIDPLHHEMNYPTTNHPMKRSLHRVQTVRTNRKKN